MRIGGTAKTSVEMSRRTSWPSGRVGWRRYRRPCRRWKPRRRLLTNRPRPKVVSIRGCPTTKPSATSFTDAESRIMPAPGGKDFLQADNCQAVVDSAHHVILAVRATKAPSTSNCLPQRSTANWIERWNNSGSLFPRWPNCWRTPRRTSWPARPSRCHTGRSCGPTTRRNG